MILTCICPSCTGPTAEHVVTDASGREWRFEMHPWCGPIILRADGDPKARQPGDRSAFWPAFERWRRERADA